jgi:hypothetical protein
VILLDKNGSTAKVVAKELAKKGFSKVPATIVHLSRAFVYPKSSKSRRVSFELPRLLDRNFFCSRCS